MNSQMRCLMSTILIEAKPFKFKTNIQCGWFCWVLHRLVYAVVLTLQLYQWFGWTETAFFMRQNSLRVSPENKLFIISNKQRFQERCNGLNHANKFLCFRWKINEEQQRETAWRMRARGWGWLMFYSPTLIPPPTPLSLVLILSLSISV